MPSCPVNISKDEQDSMSRRALGLDHEKKNADKTDKAMKDMVSEKDSKDRDEKKEKINKSSD